MDMYPDAKVILNQRKSSQIWVKSVQKAFGFFNTKTFRFITYLFKTNRMLCHMAEVASRARIKKFGYNIFSVELYDKYNEWVRNEAAKRGKEVLEFQVEQGWGPLCEFLGKPLPPSDVPFPYLNDQRAMAILKTIFVIRGLLAWSALVGAVYGSSILIKYFLSRYIRKSKGHLWRK